MSELQKQPAEGIPPTASSKLDLYSWLQALVFALVVLILAFTFFGRIIGVEGTSMVPTLHNRDMLLLQCIDYTPKQGDVVVLTKEFADITNPIVKRVIAVGGQTIQVDYASNSVTVDGQVLEEPYINGAMEVPGSPYMQKTSWQVPEGSIFVMGDNRNHSSDSRDERLGLVDTRYVLGRALVILLPFQDIGTIS